MEAVVHLFSNLMEAIVYLFIYFPLFIILNVLDQTLIMYFLGCVSFYRVNSDMAFERHRSRIPINDLNIVHALKKHLIQFLAMV